MSDFAITLWVWELTGSATSLALTGFFYQLPRIITAIFAGIVVDRFSRKYLMILSEAAVVVSTLMLLMLHLTGQLAIWHLYLAASINGGFEKFGQLAYRASITLLVAPKNYTRANSMDTAIGYSSNIIAPAVAGILYPIIRLGGIFSIKLVLMAIALSILALLQIPQPNEGRGSAEDEERGRKGEPSGLPTNSQVPKSSAYGTPPAELSALSRARPPVTKERVVNRLGIFWSEVTFGIRYLWQSPGLRSLLIVTNLFVAVHSLSNTIYDPMILARTDGSSQTLGAVATISGFGGVIGAIAFSIWGGFRSNVRGMRAGYIGVGLAKIGFGLGQSLFIWLPAQFCSSINFPLIWSSEGTLWMKATPAKLQGRVFAAGLLIEDLANMLAILLAGLLSDRIFEPAMRSPSLLQSLFAPIFGTGAGSGIALLYVLSAIAMLLIGIFSFRVSKLYSVEQDK